jgi:pyruvate/2-oxoglutarate dehydrogenase complex dihydrolipoamide dehydrogenase (E3) component
MRSEKSACGSCGSHRLESPDGGQGDKEKGVKIDWPSLMRFKQSFVAPVPKHREDSFAKAGIAMFHGRARFADRTTVRVGERTWKQSIW